MEENYIIDLENVTVRFNMATEKIDNLKEYFVKLVKRQLMFEEFLALKNITLQIRPGEAWGLVGTNGAGKSTMLKLISGILTPYKGTVTVNGTIAPLIELGAGFDMELTARENIFLNGTLLGHSRKFMEEHFDEKKENHQRIEGFVGIAFQKRQCDDQLHSLKRGTCRFGRGDRKLKRSSLSGENAREPMHPAL